MKDKPNLSVISQWGEFAIVPVDLLESNLSPRAVLVFIALMSRVSHNGDAARCWPSYEAIQQRCAVKSREAINAGLDELEAKGYLHRERRFSASTVYTLTRPAQVALAGAAAAPAERISSESERMTGAPVVRNPNDSSSESERPVVRNPNANQIQEPETQKKSQSSPARASRGGGADAEHALFADKPKAQIPEQPRVDSALADEPVTPSPETAKRVRKVRRALDDHEAERHRELFDGLTVVCVVDARLMGKRIARTAKQLREADPTAVRATMDEFLDWWKRSDWRGKKGKPPTLDQVTANWKLFRGNYAEQPAAQPTDKAQKGTQYIDRLARLYTEVINGQ